MDEERLGEFVGRVVSDLAAAESAAVAYLGDRLGLYRALAGAGPLTPAELAGRTRTNERLVREWLHNQVAGGYVGHDARTGTFELPAEHAAVLADESSSVFLAGVLEIVAAMWADAGHVESAFRGDGGLHWGHHDERLYSGTERLFAPIYRSQLTSEWIPALDGVEQKLRAGARVADVGCGTGVSTVVLAQTYGASRFVGSDVHAGSVETARRRATEAGVDDRVDFRVEDATAFSGSGFDLVCFLDSLHDMGDPVAAAARARASLAPGGTLLVVEPMAQDRLEDNVNPVSRLYYAGSVFLCTPSSLAQDPGTGLGAQAGPTRLVEVLRAAGFPRVRVALETPFNLVLEARS
ncbi:MAG: methyltransferase domain-containing protein [Acidimicrobiia bacterium]|nr:methyltransferase domain-containing protein [Acidimicrobiia bacterium]